MGQDHSTTSDKVGAAIAVSGQGHGRCSDVGQQDILRDAVQGGALCQQRLRAYPKKREKVEKDGVTC